MLLEVHDSSLNPQPMRITAVPECELNTLLAMDIASVDANKACDDPELLWNILFVIAIDLLFGQQGDCDPSANIADGFWEEDEFSMIWLFVIVIDPDPFVPT